MWIESHQSLLTHRKTGRLARSLAISKITAIGHLHAFWWWCMDNAPTGVLSGIDAEDIADGAVWEGDPGQFIEALVYAGFVDTTDDLSLVVHNWMRYAGRLIEKREKDAERKRIERQKKDDGAPSPVRTDHVQRTSAGHPRDGAGTVPNRTPPNRTRPNQEDTPPLSPTPAPAKPSPPDGGGRVRAVPKPTTLNAHQQERFDRWYRQYPRKQHRPEAERAWRKIDPDDALTLILIADLGARQRGRKWADGIIEHPATYLNQRAWEDDIEPIRTGPTPIRGGQRETTDEYNRRIQREVLGDGPDDIPGVIDAAWRSHEQEAECRSPQILVGPVRRPAR